MSLAEHLGRVKRVTAPGECGVCAWYAALDAADQDTFDEVIASGANKSEVWRRLTAWPENPLPVKRARFSECLNHHDRGGTLVAR